MTALCGGGTSSARPEFGEFVYVAPAALGAFLNNIPTPWAVALAGYIGRVTFNLATFCPSDPPAVPTFTAADVVSLLNPYNPFTYNDAQQKFQDLIGAFMWTQLCRCDNGTVPAAPAAPAAPSGMPSIDPPAVGPAYPTGQPCASYSATFSGTPPNIDSPSSPPVVPIPSGATSITLAVQPSRPMVTADGTGWQVNINCFDTPTHFIGNPVFYGESSSGVGGTLTAILPTGTLYTRALLSVFHVDTPIDIDVQYSLYCGSASQPSVPLPCPSDPFVMGLLEQILALVTITQRQAAPFAYISGASHAGLSGSGSFAVQGLLGARINITDFGFNTGMESGDPGELWHAGWVNWGNADGVSTRVWLTNAEMLTLPSAAGQYTSLHYSLEPGVVVTITDLEREP